MNYKGNDAYQTSLGALFSISVKVLTFVIFLIKTSELVKMSDPSVQLYSRPIYKEESDEFGEMNLHDYKVDLGIALLDKKNGVIPLPDRFGRFMSKFVGKDKEGNKVED